MHIHDLTSTHPNAVAHTPMTSFFQSALQPIADIRPELLLASNGKLVPQRACVTRHRPLGPYTEPPSSCKAHPQCLQRYKLLPACLRSPRNLMALSDFPYPFPWACSHIPAKILNQHLHPPGCTTWTAIEEPSHGSFACKVRRALQMRMDML